jgi:hypothetical protein
VSNYSDLILATAGLVSYWRLGEASGNALDSKDSNPGVPAGGLTRAVTGLLVGDADKATQGDGVKGTYIASAYAANLNVGAQLTFECWVKPSAFQASSTYVIGRARVGTSCWYIRNYGGSDLRWEARVKDANSVDTTVITNNAADYGAVGKLQHLVVTYDAAGSMKFYVNGVSVASQNRTPNANVFNQTSDGIQIFDAFNGAATGMAGVIDEVAVYNTVLTAAQVLSHYNVGLGAVTYTDTPSGTLALSGTGTDRNIVAVAVSGSVALSGSCVDIYEPVYNDAPSGRIAFSGTCGDIYHLPQYSQVILGTAGLISYWRLGEASGQALDSKDSNPGTVNGALTRQATGLLAADSDKAMSSDGAVGNVIDVPHNAANMPSSIAQWSVECWAKPLVVPPAADVRIVNGGPLTRWFLELNNNRSWRFYVRPVSGSDIQAGSPISGPQAPAVGVRQHLVGVFDSTGVKFYVNGVLTASSSSPGLAVNGGGPWNIFAQGSGFPSFPGTLDEVAVYNVALTSQQIAFHYQVGKTPYETPSGTIALSGTLKERYTQPGWLSPRIRERPPLRNMIDALTPNGRHYRWAGDEPRAENVFSGLRWSSTIPGGHENLDCVLTRDPGVIYNDMERFTTLKIINAGGTVVGEFRLERTPQTAGDQLAISPSAVGWQAHLDDNKAVTIIFIDRELGEWVGPNSQRRLALIAAACDPLDPRTTQGDDGLPSIVLGPQGAWARQNNTEMYYFMPPGDYAGRVKFDYQASNSVNPADANWVGDVYAGSADGYSTFTSLVADYITGPTSGSVNGDASAVANASRRSLMVRLRYATGPAGLDNGQFDVFLRNVRVFGNHGLTIRGSTAQTEGFFASDIIRYAVSNFAPLLKINPDSFRSGDFIIPQSKFADGTTAGEIVKQSTRFGLEDWAVWNDKTLLLCPRNSNPLARRWRARITPAKLEQTGQQADRLWESIVVQFNDVDGSTRTVGPPGSGCDVESSYLKDLDPDNPANRLGMTRRDKLVMGISTAAGAIEVGRRFLEEQKALDRSGKATLVGHVEDDHGTIYPYSEVKAGDLVTFVDAADTSYRRIVKADHDDTAKSAPIDLDAPPEGLQAVLERLGVVLVPLGL